MSLTFQRYQQHYATQSDIQHHLGLLFSLAHGNVLELGTRGGVSTAALLAGVERHGGHVWSVDLDDCSQVAAGHEQWTFIQGSSTDPGPVLGAAFGYADSPSDTIGWITLLLIDTEHTYSQATAELALWGPHVAPGGHICMHDPETFPGVRRAAQEFAAAQGWPITIVLPCNGMAVIRRPE
jgi:cephalosporin hydroxylase